MSKKDKKVSVRVGDVVQLNSGGPKMTVQKVGRKGITTIFFDDHGVRAESVCLQPEMLKITAERA